LDNWFHWNRSTWGWTPAPTASWVIPLESPSQDHSDGAYGNLGASARNSRAERGALQAAPAQVSCGTILQGEGNPLPHNAHFRVFSALNKPSLASERALPSHLQQKCATS